MEERLAKRMKRTFLAVSEYAAVTLSLAVGAALLWLVGGVIVGVISALRRGSFFDRAAMGIALDRISRAYAERGIFP